MYKGLDLHFEYVIRFSDGSYHGGNVRDGFEVGKGEALPYTEKGAYAKISSMKHYYGKWKTAKVERI